MVDVGPDPSGQKSESPFFLLGKVVMQQSYVCALIAMMVITAGANSTATFLSVV